MDENPTKLNVSENNDTSQKKVDINEAVSDNTETVFHED